MMVPLNLPMGNFYREMSIVSYEMFTHYNVPLINFFDNPEARKLESSDVTALPAVFRVGAIDYKLGVILAVRKGRDEMFGEVAFELEGSMEFDEEGNAVKFVYKKEKSG